MVELCTSCGSRIEMEIVGNYNMHDLEEELRMCRDCVENPPVRIQELFDRIAEGLNDENSEEFEEMEISMKGTVALHMIEKGLVEGGTAGHIETLRSMVASEV